MWYFADNSQSYNHFVGNSMFFAKFQCGQPSRAKVDQHMPCLNSELFSSYKNHTTLKGLVGISPGGAIIFISQLYTGHISDREIVTRSGFLNLPFGRGDPVMADKGFTV